MTAAPPGPEKGSEPPVPARPTWTFLTNHGHVLLSVAADPQVRIADIAARVGITPRSTLQILKDLEEGGYLQRIRAGRRTRYAIEPHQHFRHPATASWEIDGLIGLFSNVAPSADAGAPKEVPGR
ncbi:helix-turn-helix transcriptional regulator [Arthrobacter sp. PsM3]|uniref:helix-turn-helix transcriptional regulator n=1 Tax=Arthrobacter sp. PsM3 TaxID=3030531 RepID=UPI00263B943A|nr:winged helix-turn-helix domain-containing protein [Arthrobacter sp. PsM3]MDN4644268.1 winged helix-turn-helix domain-containing protein [Arthrobacter sp. PsM3]